MAIVIIFLKIENFFDLLEPKSPFAPSKEDNFRLLKYNEMVQLILYDFALVKFGFFLPNLFSQFSRMDCTTSLWKITGS